MAFHYEEDLGEAKTEKATAERVNSPFCYESCLKYAELQQVQNMFFAFSCMHLSFFISLVLHLLLLF